MVLSHITCSTVAVVPSMAKYRCDPPWLNTHYRFDIHQLLQEDPGIQYTLHCAPSFTVQHNMRPHTHTQCYPTHQLNIMLQWHVNKWLSFFDKGGGQINGFIFKSRHCGWMYTATRMFWLLNLHLVFSPYGYAHRCSSNPSDTVSGPRSPNTTIRTLFILILTQCMVLFEHVPCWKLLRNKWCIIYLWNAAD